MPAWSPRANEIFLAAIEFVDSAARRAHLDERCGDDADLRRQVEALLAAHEQAGSFLDEPANVTADVSSAAAKTVPPRATSPLESAGVQIGPYKLLESIGEGGMGSVWMAEQRAPVRRKVALKLIKAGMDTAQVIARFEAERQALALMDHPNIAKVLDAGQSDTGRPYFVMELVKGTPITEYCDQHRLAPAERLELFIQVCRAIQHAHQKGIIHRDLKPSNVLVAPFDGRPMIKVIDFGVAKAVGQQLTERTMFTGFGAMIGTLQYMSPEQAELNNQDIDTRSDIYSLGVLLYELLTGSTPLDMNRLKGAALAAVLVSINEDEPPKPSTRLSESKDSLPSIAAQRHMEPAKLAKLVRGDLDWIVMKALSKNRSRRYETANGLARDIERYLANEPVEAGPPSMTYRLRKLIRRKQGAVIAAALVVLALVGGVIGTSVGMVQARHAEARAIQEANEKERARSDASASAELARAGFDDARRAVDRSFTLVSQNRLLKVPGLQPLRLALLQEAQSYYRDFSKRWGNEPALRTELANATFRLSMITSEIGSKDLALAQLTEASKLYQAILNEQPDDFVARRALTTCDNNIGLILLNLERYAEALVAFERCEAGWAKLLVDSGGNADIEADKAQLRGNIALALNHLGRRDEALTRLESAIAFQRRKLEAAPGEADRLHTLSGLLNSLGSVRTGQRQYEEAAVALRDAVATERAALKADPTDAGYQSWLGNHCFNLAVLCEIHLHRLDEALVARKEAAEVWGKLAAENPAVTEYRFHVAQANVDLGNLLVRLPGKEDPAPHFAKARELFEQLTRDHPDIARFHSSFGSALDATAGLFFKADKPDEACPLLDEAVRQQERAITIAPEVAQYRRFLVTHYTNLARINSAGQRSDDAIHSLERTLPILEKLIQEGAHPVSDRFDLARNLNTIGQIMAKQTRVDESFRAHHRAVSAVEDIVKIQPENLEMVVTLASACDQLEIDLLKAGRRAEAEAAREHQAEFWKQLAQQPGAKPRAALEHARACLHRGELAADKRDAVVALVWFGYARSDLEGFDRNAQSDEMAPLLLGRTLKWIGDIHWVRAKPADAKPAWEGALKVYRENLLPTDPKRPSWNRTVGGLLHNLGRIHGDAGRQEQALQCYQEAVKYQKIAFAKEPESSREWLDHHYEILATTLRELCRRDESINAVRARVKLWPDDPRQLVKAAGEIARCISLTSGDAALGQSLVDESMALLKQAVDKGYRDAGQLKADPSLAPLRERAEFQKLVVELEKKSPP
jgi:serine/threonine protein kinase/tetratricopeptide (TPR) repeat protein